MEYMHYRVGSQNFTWIGGVLELLKEYLESPSSESTLVHIPL